MHLQFPIPGGRVFMVTERELIALKFGTRNPTALHNVIVVEAVPKILWTKIFLL